MNPPERELVVWSIFENPADAPGKFVARRFHISKGQVVPGLGFTEDTLAAARRRIPPYLVRLPPSGGDVACLVESYI